MLCRNRTRNDRGFSHGGVALIFNTGACTFKLMDYPNPENFEVLPCIGSLPGHSRKMLIISCYLPPGYDVRKGKACLDHVSDHVLHCKAKYKEPYLVIMGDFSQWNISEALSHYRDIGEASVGPTRGSRCLDRIFVSFVEDILSLIHI